MNSGFEQKKESLIDKLKVISTDIKEGRINPFYFLYGTEEYFLSSLEKNIKKAFVDNTGINTKIYDENNFDYDEVCKYLISMPMMNDKKLIIFKNCSLFRTKKVKGKNASKNDNVNNISDTTNIDNIDHNINNGLNNNQNVKNNTKSPYILECFNQGKDINIILIIEEEYEKGYESFYTSSNIYINFVNKSNGVVLNLDKLDDADLNRYISMHFKKANIDIDKTELAYFLNRCGKNIINLFNEADKLIAYVGEDKKITRNLIDECTSRNLNESVFKMLDLINAKKTNEAMKLYGDLTSEGTDEFQIFALFSYQYENLIEVMDLVEKGLSVKDIISKLRLRDFQVRNFINIGKSTTKEKVNEKLKNITKLSTEYMHGNIDKTLMLELLFV